MGPKRTFETDAERAAYITGYQDAINTARFSLAGTAAVAGALPGGEVIEAALLGVSGALERHAKEVV